MWRIGRDHPAEEANDCCQNQRDKGKAQQFSEAKAELTLQMSKLHPDGSSLNLDHESKKKWGFREMGKEEAIFGLVLWIQSKWWQFWGVGNVLYHDLVGSGCVYVQKIMELYTSDLGALLCVWYKSIQKEKKSNGRNVGQNYRRIMTAIVRTLGLIWKALGNHSSFLGREKTDRYGRNVQGRSEWDDTEVRQACYEAYGMILGMSWWRPNQGSGSTNGREEHSRHC